jgi:predicted CoA-substrate-specific enzyme activase
MNISCGIDSGSTVTKIAVLLGREVVYTASSPSGTDPAGSGRALLEKARAEVAGRVGADPWSICVTGYGRKLLGDLGSQKTEISCHAMGVHSIINGLVTFSEEQGRVPAAPSGGFTLLDIGGQDSKSIKVGPDGRALDFAMNDKCAAGTGRFLEVISRTLGFGVAGVSAAAMASQRTARLSSMCTVFADSEVVSLTSQGVRPDEIAWAACYAVAERCAGLVKRLGAKDRLYFSGGVSEIGAVGAALQTILGLEIVVPPLARFSGAIGAAVYAGTP